MKGLVIWPYSECRSTMATYRALISRLGVPAKIAILRANIGCGMATRTKTGFRADEFADLDKAYVNLDYNAGMRIISESPGWNHMFCEFQNSAVTRRLIKKACESGSRVVVACEAPCNMFSGWKWFAKEIYMRTVVPFLSRSVVRRAEAYVNYSGNDERAHRFCRWAREKTLPFGYYPPPIEGSQCFERKSNANFKILSTGILSRYRGADILIQALKILKDFGVQYSAIITQGGELLPKLKQFAHRHSLPVKFPGFLEMSDLIKEYESCSVYVGAGRSEPWGMRLNDALNCGAPLVVSNGMGGRMLVEDYGCGFVFNKADPMDLALKLRTLAQDANTYAEIAHNAFMAAKHITPETKVEQIVNLFKRLGWIE